MDTFNGGNPTGQENLDRQLRGEYQVDVFGYINQALALYRQEFLKFIGYVLVLFLAYLVSQSPLLLLLPESIDWLGWSYVFDSYPIVALIVVISGIFYLMLIPLYSGMSIVAYKMMSGYKVRFADFFRGYKYVKPLVVFSLAQGVIFFIVYFVFASVSVLVLLLTVVFPFERSTEFVLVLMTLLSLVTMLYFLVSFIFSPLLIIDRRMEYWQAMEMSRKVVMKNWFSIFWLLVVLAFFNMIGSSVMWLGLPVTIPLSALTLAVAYREIFGLAGSDW